MRFNLCLLVVATLFVLDVQAQGTFIYDQQSATESTPGESGGLITPNQPMGQSFTPSLSSVDFIRLELHDGFSNNALGGTLYVNLRTNSITGPILGASGRVSLADGFSGFANFFFSASVPLTPGTLYFFQPVVESGDQWIIGSSPPQNYPGGTIFVNGLPNTASDLWFREGIVPEPSSALLVLIGGSAFIYFRRRTA